ncbi:MAG: XdhC family protein [Anaerolineae bacterium]|nr:XdhC family protein [Anaerolineae bacterium]
MKTSIFKMMSDLETQNEAFVLCTIINNAGSTPRHQGSKMIVKPNGETFGTVGGGEVEQRVINEALTSLKNGTAKILHYQLNDPSRGDPGICGGQVDVYVEPVCPAPKVIVIGAGHVGVTVAQLAKWSGFRVAISDDREDLISEELKSEMDEYWVGPIDQIPNHIQIESDSFLVLTTRGSDVDIQGLPHLLKSAANYVGVIGSKRRWAFTRKALTNDMVPDELFSKIHTPIGLEINAETPREIAVSIMAEIIKIWRNPGEAE